MKPYALILVQPICLLDESCYGQRKRYLCRIVCNQVDVIDTAALTAASQTVKVGLTPQDVKVTRMAKPSCRQLPLD